MSIKKCPDTTAILEGLEPTALTAERLEALRSAGMTPNELAYGIGLRSKATLYNWLHQKTVPRRKYDRVLDDIRHVTRILITEVRLEPNEAVAWLTKKDMRDNEALYPILDRIREQPDIVIEKIGAFATKHSME